MECTLKVFGEDGRNARESVLIVNANVPGGQQNLIEPATEAAPAGYAAVQGAPAPSDKTSRAHPPLYKPQNAEAPPTAAPALPPHEPAPVSANNPATNLVLRSETPAIPAPPAVSTPPAAAEAQPPVRSAVPALATVEPLIAPRAVHQV